MDCRKPGFPVLHYLSEFAQIHIHLSWWYYLIISSSAAFSFAFNLFQHLRLFQWVSSSYLVTKELEFQLQHQSFPWILISPKIDWFDLLAVQRTLKSLLQHHSSKASYMTKFLQWYLMSSNNWFIHIIRFSWLFQKCPFTVGSFKSDSESSFWMFGHCHTTQ